MAKPLRSREQLLTDLRDIFLARGYEGATLTEMARATGLGKASLYHHFPGGKSEMAAALLRDAVAQLDDAFSRLRENRSPAEQLDRFIDSFAGYVDGGARPCLVAVFAQGSISDAHGVQIADQYRHWEALLSEVFANLGSKPKRAERQAQALIAGLYGYLLSATLHRDPGIFRRGVKNLKKSIPD